MQNFFKKKINISIYMVILFAFIFLALLVVLVMNLQRPTAEAIVLPETSGDVILLPGEPADVVFLPASAGGDPTPVEESQLPTIWNVVYNDIEFGSISQRIWLCVRVDNETYADWDVHRTLTGLKSDCYRELYQAILD